MRTVTQSATAISTRLSSVTTSATVVVRKSVSSASSATRPWLHFVTSPSLASAPTARRLHDFWPRSPVRIRARTRTSRTSLSLTGLTPGPVSVYTVVCRHTTHSVTIRGLVVCLSLLSNDGTSVTAHRKVHDYDYR